MLKVLAAGLVLAASLTAQQGIYSNRRAPSFTLPEGSFKRHDILDYRGKWLLIDFMKTDCPHCKALTAVLEKAKVKYGAAKVAVLKIVITPPENQDTVGKYIRENKVTSPILFDIAGQVAGAYFNATPQKASFDTPHLFIINPQGQIVQDYGHSDQNHDIIEGEGLFKILDALFAGRPAPAPLPAKK
jgi:thioredoxin-dependent peroxiredoxin